MRDIERSWQQDEYTQDMFFLEITIPWSSQIRLIYQHGEASSFMQSRMQSNIGTGLRISSSTIFVDVPLCSRTTASDIFALASITSYTSPSCWIPERGRSLKPCLTLRIGLRKCSNHIRALRISRACWMEPRSEMRAWILVRENSWRVGSTESLIGGVISIYRFSSCTKKSYKDRAVNGSGE